MSYLDIIRNIGKKSKDIPSGKIEESQEYMDLMSPESEIKKSEVAKENNLASILESQKDEPVQEKVIVDKFDDEVLDDKIIEKSVPQKEKEKSYESLNNDYLSSGIKLFKEVTSGLSAYLYSWFAKEESVEIDNYEKQNSKIEIEKDKETEKLDIQLDKILSEESSQNPLFSQEDVEKVRKGLENVKYLRQRIDTFAKDDSQTKELNELKDYLDRLNKGIYLIAERIVQYSNVKPVQSKKDPRLDDLLIYSSKVGRAVARIEKAQKDLENKVGDLYFQNRPSEELTDPVENPEGKETKLIIDEKGNISFDQERLEKLFATEALNTRRIIMNALKEVASRSELDYNKIGSMVYASVVTAGYGARESKIIGGSKGTQTQKIKPEVEIDFETVGKQFLKDMAQTGEITAELKGLRNKLDESEQERIETQRALIQLSSLMKNIDVTSTQRNDKLVSDVKSSVGDMSSQVSENLEKQRTMAFREIVKKVDSQNKEISEQLVSFMEEVRDLKRQMSSGYAVGLGGDMKRQTVKTKLPMKKGNSEVWNLDSDKLYEVAVQCIDKFPDLLPRRRSPEDFAKELKIESNLNHFLGVVEREKGKKVLDELVE